VTLQRLSELVIAGQHRAAAGHGRREHAPGHYPLIVAVHAGWLATLFWLAPDAAIHWPLFACSCCCSRAAVGAADAWAPLDDADHRASERAAGHRRAVPLRVATPIIWW
jgi:hypothetical protein